MSTSRKNRILASIILLISMMMSGGIRSAQAAPTFNESPVILSNMGITFNGAPVRKIDWTSYDGFAFTAGTATNAGNSNTVDGIHIGTTTVGKWCTTDGTAINCTSNSPLMSFTELDPLVSAWAKAPAKPAYTFNEIGSGSIGATTGYFSGNVGIGKTAPAFALDVDGVVNATNLYVNGSAYIGSQWTTTSTSIYYNAGNVGIGTTTPASKLQVYGTTGRLAIFGEVGVSNAIANPVNVSFGSTYGNSTPGSVNNLKWDLFTSASSGSRYGIGMSSNLMEFQSGPNGGLGFFVNQGTEAMRILSTGNIGIGTTNPGITLWNSPQPSKLDVSGGIRINSGSMVSAGEIDSIQFAKYHTTSGAQYQYSLGEIRSFTTNGYKGGLRFYTSGGINTPDNMNAVMTLNELGNVGIGTTTPLAKLQVTGGNIRLDINRAVEAVNTINNIAPLIYLDSSNFARFGEFTNTNGFYIGTATYAQIAGINSKIITFTSSSTERMRIDSGGNVGIGKTNPAVNLDVSGAISAGGTVSGTGLCIGADCNVGWLWKGAQNGNIYNGTTGAGNVGIGITNPSAKLHIVGGMILNRTPISDADYTALGTDYIIAFTSLSAQRTLTLPNALCTSGRVFLIVNETNSGFSVNVDPEGATLIVGQTNVLLPAYNSTPIYCSGSNWYMY